jgi:hypothetical protein
MGKISLSMFFFVGQNNFFLAKKPYICMLI